MQPQARAVATASAGVLASWVPADAVDDAVAVTGKKAQRRGGKPPPRVTAYLVMALALLADEDCEEVAARLAGTLADWGGWEKSWGRVPTSGGMEWDVPDTAANREAFGIHVAGGSQAAYPKAWVAAVSECASRAPVRAAMGGIGP